MVLGRLPVLAAAAAAGLVGLGACGGDAGNPAAPAVVTVPAAPGANIDPNATGTFTGPVNRARDVAGDADQRTQRLDEQTATSAP